MCIQLHLSGRWRGSSWQSHITYGPTETLPYQCLPSDSHRPSNFTMPAVTLRCSLSSPHMLPESQHKKFLITRHSRVLDHLHCWRGRRLHSPGKGSLIIHLQRVCLCGLRLCSPRERPLLESWMILRHRSWMNHWVWGREGLWGEGTIRRSLEVRLVTCSVYKEREEERNSLALDLRFSTEALRKDQ